MEIAKTLHGFKIQFDKTEAKHDLLTQLDNTISAFSQNIYYNSFNLITAKKFLAYHYMNTGALNNVARAKVLLLDGISAFERGTFAMPEQLSVYHQMKLLLALTNEFYGNHNKAFTEYEESIHEIESSYPFLNEETKNVFYRLMYILEPIASLESRIVGYKGINPLSVYQNKRRIVEKAIYAGKAKESQVLELNDMFNLVKGKLDHLYHVTHYRLLYQYYFKKGEGQIAESFYHLAIDSAVRCEFYGQVVRIESIKKELEG